MGKLIIFEGLDGSGKGTQAELACQNLHSKGYDPLKISFPDYDSPSSALVKMYLAGQFGDKPDDVNAYAASSFYAVDRYAGYKSDWGKFYEEGGILIADRYTTSNAVHQGGKLEGKAREEFFSWLYDLEFNRMGLPKPDLVLWLDMPVEIAETLMRRRERDTSTKADIHERDDGYLHKCREGDYFGWTRVSCVRDGKLRSIEDIHEELYARVKSCLEEV